jgi:hypothetical protein
MEYCVSGFALFKDCVISESVFVYVSYLLLNNTNPHLNTSFSVPRTLPGDVLTNTVVFWNSERRLDTSRPQMMLKITNGVMSDGTTSNMEMSMEVAIRIPWH